MSFVPRRWLVSAAFVIWILSSAGSDWLPTGVSMAAPGSQLTDLELLERAERYRSRAPEGRGDEYVFQLAACLKNADNEGTLNDAWADQCAQDVAVAVLAAPPPPAEPTRAPEAAGPTAELASPIATPTLAPMASAGQSQANVTPEATPMSGDATLRADCDQLDSIDRQMCRASITANTEMGDCYFFQMHVAGLTFEEARMICGTPPAFGQFEDVTGPFGGLLEASVQATAQAEATDQATQTSQTQANAQAQAPSGNQGSAPGGASGNRCAELKREAEALVARYPNSLNFLNDPEYLRLSQEAASLRCPR